MNILLLGGSNAGMRDGWAAQFAAKAATHTVENRFLGAVGSLYGVMALLKRARDGGPRPDLVIFEYCLNDILLVDAGVLGGPLIVDALDAVAAICARERIALLFLCLEPRPLGEAKPRKAIARVHPLYAEAAQRGAFPCLWLREIIAEELTAGHFVDENHLNPEASGRIADAVLAAIDSGLAVPRGAGESLARFDYIDATQATTRGPCRLHRLTSKVFEGPFLEIARGGRSLWPGRGRLVGLMLQSNDSSGVYSIRAKARMFRKNSRSQMQEAVRNLMLLHYATRAIDADVEVEIAMPDDERQLMRLPEDRTIIAAPAVAPFEAQTLEIHGVMLWRPRAWPERARDVLSRLIKGRAGRSASAGSG